MADGFEIALGELADGNTIRAWAQGTTNRLDEQLIEAAYLKVLGPETRQPGASGQVKSKILTREVLTKAGIFLTDAARNRKILDVNVDSSALKLYTVYQSLPVRIFLVMVILLNLIIAYWERPSSHEISIVYSNLIELLCMCVFTAELIVRYKVFGKSYLRNKWTWVRIGVIISILFDIVLDFVVVSYLDRYSRILRVFFLVDYSDYSRRMAKQMLETLKNMMRAIAVILLFVGVYSVFGAVLFINKEPTYFSDFFETFINLFTAMTTTNFPDVMIPAYELSNWYLVFFVSFMVLGFFFGYNMTIAYAYQYFKQAMMKEALKNYRVRRAALLAAFRTLDLADAGKIPVQTWRSIYAYMFPHASADQVQATLDTIGHVAAITPKDFFVLCDAHMMPQLSHEQGNRFANTELAKLLSSIQRKVWFDIPRLKRVLDHPLFTLVPLTLLTLNAVAIVVCVEEGKSVIEPVWTFVIDTLMSSLFLAESVLRMLVEGLWVHWWNKFDSLVMLVVIIGKVFIEGLAPHTDAVMRTALLIRSLKLLRLMTVKPARGFVRSTMTLLTTLANFAAVLLLLYYVFALLGIYFFGGLLVRSRKELADIDYGKLDYYELANFNTFPSALMCLFHIMVVNNWWVTMRATIAVTNRWSVIFYISFYFLVVVIAMNLVIAFMIEAVRFLISNSYSSEDSESLVQRIYRDELEQLVTSEDSAQPHNELTHSRKFVKRESTIRLLAPVQSRNNVNTLADVTAHPNDSSEQSEREP